MKDSLAQQLVDYENRKHEIKLYSHERKNKGEGCLLNNHDFYLIDEMVSTAISMATRMTGHMSTIVQESYTEALEAKE